MLEDSGKIEISQFHQLTGIIELPRRAGKPKISRRIEPVRREVVLGGDGALRRPWCRPQGPPRGFEIFGRPPKVARGTRVLPDQIGVPPAFSNFSFQPFRMPSLLISVFQISDFSISAFCPPSSAVSRQSSATRSPMSAFQLFSILLLTPIPAPDKPTSRFFRAGKAPIETNDVGVETG